jgi:hypothetical protein
LFSRKVIAGAFALLLLIGQFASLVHSVDHPFHQADDYCTSFIHCEQHDLIAGHGTLKSELSVLTFEKYVFSKQPVKVHFSLTYSSRAPPIIS